jgi:ketosteroid isomerase-like protein
MSAHPNVATVDEMTQAIFARDLVRLGEIFTEDLVFHARGPLPIAGDHVGLEGFLGAMGRLFELSEGNIKLDQLFCMGQDDWASEFERAHITVHGRSFEMNNAFVYRFERGRIAEMWFLSAGAPETAAYWNPTN